MTIPEYYGQRFGQGVRVLGGLILALAGILNMGAFLKAGALFVTSLTGLNDPIMINIVMVILIVLVLSYTILGGMVSVVITDYVQFVVLALGMLMTCVYAVSQTDWDTIVTTVKEVHGEGGFDPTSGFGPTYMFWMIYVFGIGSCAVWPTAVMRVCAAENVQVVRRLYTWSSIGFMTRMIIPQFLGICALTYFWNNPEVGSEFFVDGKIIENGDVTIQAMPTYLGQLLPVGAIGLIAAGMLAAFMSTHDSYLLCWASVIVEDVIHPLYGGTLTTRNRLVLARILIFLTGMFLLVWGIWYPMGQDMLDYLAVSGSIYITGAFPLLAFGLYWKRASRTGAYLALLAGCLSVLGLPPVAKALGLTNERLGFALDEASVVMFVASLAIVLMVVGSLLFPDRASQTATKSKQQTT